MPTLLFSVTARQRLSFDGKSKAFLAERAGRVDGMDRREVSLESSPTRSDNRMFGHGRKRRNHGKRRDLCDEHGGFRTH